MLLKLAQEIGLSPKKTSSTNGGEYHSSCPNCGGKDRFFIQPHKQMKKSTGYYQCRQCEKKGDVIQFCKDFMGLTYLEACAKTDQKAQENSHSSHFQSKPSFTLKQMIVPSKEWIEQATDFMIHSHRCALNNATAMRLLKDRGFAFETIEKFRMGWNELNRWDSSTLWGICDDKASKNVWLPQGIVIPTFFENQVMKLKVRRSAISPGDNRKYVIVPRGRNSPSFFGDDYHKPIVILESELDAILIQQFCSDICNCMAIPAGNKPDDWADKILYTNQLLLFSMDFDEAGKKTFAFWKSTYPQIRAWIVPRGKSPGDAYLQGVNLRHWIEQGIKL